MSGGLTNIAGFRTRAADIFGGLAGASLDALEGPRELLTASAREVTTDALGVVEAYASRIGINYVRAYSYRGSYGAPRVAAGGVSAAPADKSFDGFFVGADGRAYAPGTPLAEVPAVVPRGGVTTDETFIYVNGISTTRESQSASLELIAERTGGRVIGLHNATEGAFLDIIQSAGDTLDIGRNPAVDALADTVYEEITNGRNVHLMAHSQGALITSRALTDVRSRLMVEDGLTRREAEGLLARVRVETFGGAAGAYPNGPQYVHYVNRLDPVSTFFGLGPFRNNLVAPGRGAVVHRFTERDDAHGFNETYLPRRVPFDSARRGEFD
ncbi:MAG TPA: hypothetical protein VFX96_17825 [Pyrinomonadaceae bacterium]|nr:hypothetical protein [Pyrinomonadaceae bacterium]